MKIALLLRVAEVNAGTTSPTPQTSGGEAFFLRVKNLKDDQPLAKSISLDTGAGVNRQGNTRIVKARVKGGEGSNNLIESS